MNSGLSKSKFWLSGYQLQFDAIMSLVDFQLNFRENAIQRFRHQKLG
jgi:hypothetical protein